jgi:protein-glutamine gamma-glutamyltransferase
MSTRQPDTLAHDVPPWLFASALACTLPHFMHLPIWLSALSGVFFLWAGWLWHNDRRLPGRWVLLPLVIIGCIGILSEFRTLFGRDPGVAMLVMFMSMKLLEMRSRRDAMVLLILGYFLLLTHYFHSQSIFTGIWLIVALWLVTASLIKLHATSIGIRENLRYAGLLAIQSIPFMLVLFLLFPRISGPLWGLPQDAHSGKTGLSDSMSPGSIANLVQNGEIAFRVRFDTQPPPRQQLYWRGPVMESFDGTNWRQSPGKRPQETLQYEGLPINYEITLEAHNQRWLLALDAPVELPTGASFDGRLTALAARPVDTRQRLRLSAALDYRLNIDEAPGVLIHNLQLPADSNPQTSALAKGWREAHGTPQAIVNQALRLFADPAFTYTLQPPLLGKDSVDDFLFRTRRGFCEHYAAAFVVLMRSAGIPARVVGGYQGGEMNPRDGFLVVRQSDAHAWAEVWLEKRGWTRVDPTSVVAPERLSSGIADALLFGEPLPVFMQIRGEWLRDLRHRWEAINNAWNQQVLGYDARRQRELLSRLGLPDADWRSMSIALGLASMLVLALITAWTLYQAKTEAPEIRLWRHALRRIGVNCAPGETPLALAERLRNIDPALTPHFEPVVRHFLLARYAREKPEHLAALRTAVAKLPRRRSV